MLPLGLGGDRRGLRLLCLGAHCDDIEIGCGGSLLRLLAERAGCEVAWLVLASDPERERETRASAADFLASAERTSVTVERFRDGFFPYQGAEIKQLFERLKAGPSPDLIFCPRRDDLHQDHRLVAELTWNTFRNHLIAEYEIPKYEGDLAAPNLFVPLSAAQAARKVELILRHYPSQSARSWFQASTFEAVMRLRGLECRAAEGLAEAFHCRKAVL
jgi:LmbE family N-acetylglucosaminyl deacetylase